MKNAGTRMLIFASNTVYQFCKNISNTGFNSLPPFAKTNSVTTVSKALNMIKKMNRTARLYLSIVYPFILKRVTQLNKH